MFGASRSQDYLSSYDLSVPVCLHNTTSMPLETGHIPNPATHSKRDTTTSNNDEPDPYKTIKDPDNTLLGAVVPSR